MTYFAIQTVEDIP